MAVSSRVALLLLLLAALPVFGTLSIEPYGPTPATPVTLRVPTVCGHRGQTVTRTGSLITVALQPQSGSCPSPPFIVPHHVPLGTFAPGEYHVEVTGAQDPQPPFSFVVRDADVTPYEIRPSVARTNTAGLQLQIRANVIALYDVCAGNCAATTIDVGGVVIEGTKLDRQQMFEAPLHAPGLVDVRITNPKGTYVLPRALYYFDEPPYDLSIFERVLFPVLFESAGANGSQWRSNAVIANPNLWFVENVNGVSGMICVTFPCDERLYPRSQQKFAGFGFPHGKALLMARNDAPKVAFRLHVRDVSREDRGYGTEVPVVRERDMFRNERVTLLDVPADPRYRTKLRIYAFPDPMYGGDANRNDSAIVYRVVPGREEYVERTVLEMTRNCQYDCTETPLYADIDFPAGNANERFDYSIELPEGALGWAFASTTNNDTQEVTLTTPNGGGEVLCASCY